MKRAWIGLKELPHYRRDAFAAGVARLGYAPEFRLTTTPGDNDILVIWNRFGAAGNAADHFDHAGCPVLVAENGYLGNDFAGDRWYAISRSHHNGAGHWQHYGNDRWDKLGVALAPYRMQGSELVVLPQRGIGEAGVAMPGDWLGDAARRSQGRVRPHPGTRQGVDLQQDLAKAWAVYTWGSGAAVKALMWGIPVYSDMPNWIVAGAATRYGLPLNLCDQSRLTAFRRMAWAMWRLGEIESGFAFDVLL